MRWWRHLFHVEQRSSGLRPRSQGRSKPLNLLRSSNLRMTLSSNTDPTMEIEVASEVDPIRRLPRRWKQKESLGLTSDQEIAAAARKLYDARVLARELKEEYVAILREFGCFYMDTRNGGVLCGVYLARGGTGERCETCERTEPIWLKKQEALKLAKGRLSYLMAVIRKNTPQ